MSETDKHTDEALDALFAPARADTQAPSDALMAAIMADAAAVHAQQATEPRSGIARIWAELGGWTGFGALSTAAIAGVYFGFSDPTFSTLAPGELVSSTDELAGIFPSDALFFEEG